MAMVMTYDILLMKLEELNKIIKRHNDRIEQGN